ncbi:efflux RND transporter periplasmic adaptor subunit [Cryomorpha ignava]|uniref:Efflux RND transporter periplasmic adaptor subunit n=1 Tax=Cryomorpha ignava TaxID=101383 RepID=A0A7K3WQ30_9FLAO|nr:efflux RND transporter periplasmic adaptor subunit [Cryomorpha ignava]NEN23763.1 efflux RND transporter periplasmic adaptor subunit [Cryomorpha ignava]
MKKVIFIIVSLLIVGLLAWTLYYVYQKSQEKAISFETEEPYYTDIIQKTVATGSVVPRREIDIKPVVSGIIDQLLVEPGMQVKEGDVLARIKVIPDMVSLNNAENRVDRAKIARDNAIVDFTRNQTLFDQGVISKADFQPFQLAKKNAETELEGAEDNLRIIREGASKKNSATANTLVRSTITGMVLAVPIEIGNSVIEVNNFNEGTTIATIADMSDLIFEGKVDESEVGKIKEGMDLILTIGAIENLDFNAVLEYISPKGIEENGAIQFEIKAAVNAKSDQFIRAGYSANANVVLARRDSVLAINEGLVQYENETDTYVDVKTGEQTYDRRKVELGLSDGIKVQVLSGVGAGDAIKVWNQPITEE